MKIQELQASLQNITNVLLKGRITINGLPLNGEEYAQLFADRKKIEEAILELDVLLKTISSEE